MSAAKIADIIATHTVFKTTVEKFGIPFPLTASSLKGISLSKLDHLRALNRRVDETAFLARESNGWRARGYDKSMWVVMAHRTLVSVHTDELEAIEMATRVANNPLRSICVLHVSIDGQVV